MMKKKGILLEPIMGLVLQVIITGLMFYGGYQLYLYFFDPLEITLDEIQDTLEDMRDQERDFDSVTITLKDEGNAIIGFSSAADQINFRSDFSGPPDPPYDVETFFSRPRSCAKGLACLCICKNLEINKDEDKPNPLECGSGSLRCRNLISIEFPNEISCEDLGDDGRPPYSWRIAGLGCGYEFEGGFIFGRKTSDAPIGIKKVSGKIDLDYQSVIQQTQVIRDYPTFQYAATILCMRKTEENSISIYARDEC